MTRTPLLHASPVILFVLGLSACGGKAGLDDSRFSDASTLAHLTPGDGGTGVGSDDDENSDDERPPSKGGTDNAPDDDEVNDDNARPIREPAADDDLIAPDDVEFTDDESLLDDLVSEDDIVTMDDPPEDVTTDDISEDDVEPTDDESTDDVNVDDVEPTDDEPTDDEVPPVTISTDIPEGCELDYLSGGRDYCDLGLRCDTATSSTPTMGSSDTPAGIGAAPVPYPPGYGYGSYQNASCYVQPDGQWSCSCRTASGGAQLNFPDGGPSGEEACLMAVNACEEVQNSTEPPTDLICEQNYSNSEESYCEAEQLCEQSVVVGGATVELQDSQRIFCERTSEGAECRCFSSSQSAQFKVAGVTSLRDANLCQNTLTACAGADPASIVGTPTCEFSRNSASTGYCEHTLECGQQIDLGGVNATMSGVLRTSCTEVATGVYQCTCSGGSYSSSFEVAAEASWDLCGAVSPQCEREVLDSGVPLISEGGGYYYDY